MNGVPWLRSGKGSSPAEGGCILQVIDWIHRGEWTDQPPCVHPALRVLAIQANDRMDAEGRQRLLDLAPRLMGTSDADKLVSVRLAIFCARRVLPVFEARRPGDGRPRVAIEAAEAWCADPSDEKRAAAVAAYAADAAAYSAHADATAAAAAARFDFLVAVLDEYDRITGRDVTIRVDWSPVCRVLAGVA